jgi:hypothetical protein
MIIRGHSVRLVPIRPRDGPKKNLRKIGGYHRLKKSIARRCRTIFRGDRLPIGLCFWIIAALSVGCWALMVTFAQAVSGLFL